LNSINLSFFAIVFMVQLSRMLECTLIYLYLVLQRDDYGIEIGHIFSVLEYTRNAAYMMLSKNPSHLILFNSR